MIEHHMMWARVNQQIVLCYTHINALQLNWKTLLDKRLSFQKFEEEMCFERLSRTDILLGKRMMVHILVHGSVKL